MRRLVTALFALASTAALGQTNQTSATYTIPSASLGCPVGFFASRQAIPVPYAITAAETKQTDNAQGLHLMLNRLSKPDIQRIEVTVYATSLRPRMLPLDTRSEDTISKTFELNRQTGADTLQEADVWMHEVGSVRWADLVSIAFTDGTTWHPTGDVKCRAVPSNFVPVASR
jgi:hypothetical protein